MVREERRRPHLSMERNDDDFGTSHIPKEILSNFRDIIIEGKECGQDKENFQQQCQQLLESGYTFRFIIIISLIDDLLEAGAFGDETLENVKVALSNLLPFALNLCRHPHQKEYKVIKKYTAYFSCNIKEKLSPCSSVADYFIKAMGYMENDTQDEFILLKVSSTILAITFELYLSKQELDRLIPIAKSASRRFGFAVSFTVREWVNYCHSHRNNWQQDDFKQYLRRMYSDSRMSVSVHEDHDQSTEKQRQASTGTSLSRHSRDLLELKKDLKLKVAVSSRSYPETRDQEKKREESNESSGVKNQYRNVELYRAHSDEWMYGGNSLDYGSLHEITGNRNRAVSTVAPTNQNSLKSTSDSLKLKVKNELYENTAPGVELPMKDIVSSYRDTVQRDKQYENLMSMISIDPGTDSLPTESQIRADMAKKDYRELLYRPPPDFPIDVEGPQEAFQLLPKGNRESQEKVTATDAYENTKLHHGARQRHSREDQLSVGESTERQTGKLKVPSLYSQDTDSSFETGNDSQLFKRANDLEIPELYQQQSYY
ncbi:uncharacterized protein LOC135690764 [Rhopilema esculentum]|uniref:uncharacterized protein LOC135690764 n=1 Tax=Rhopilema esculentum TaxID=499914 RepID=UPI0031E244F1|eukprot:gene1817-16307_t